MEHPCRSVDLDPMPQPPGHNEGFSWVEGIPVLTTWRLDHDRHFPSLQEDQLVAVGVTLTEMRRWSLEAGHRQ
jgi:hypothetical protein